MGHWIEWLADMLDILDDAGDELMLISSSVDKNYLDSFKMSF